MIELKYDKRLLEDPKMNQMQETLHFFKDTINSHFLKNIPIILLLNKIDLFKAKIATSDLKQCFPGYAGTLGAQERKERGGGREGDSKINII